MSGFSITQRDGFPSSSSASEEPVANPRSGSYKIFSCRSEERMTLGHTKTVEGIKRAVSDFRNIRAKARSQKFLQVESHNVKQKAGP